MTENGLQNLHARLKAVWRREQLMHITAGALAFCRWAIPLFLAGVLIDWLADLPWFARAAILITVLAVSISKAWRSGWRFARSFSATHTALAVEKRLGGLESLLVTAVQFGNAGASAKMSDSLREATLQLASQAASRVQAREVVGFQALRRPAVAAILSAVVIGVVAVVSGPILMAGVTRMVAPWLSVRYPTRTQIDLADGNFVVKEGDRAQIQARILGVIPRNAKLALRTGTGASRMHEMAINNGSCEYKMDSVFRGFEYQIIAGDARSPWYSVQVIPPPRIEHASVRLEFPAYTERPAETGEALTVVVPENTGIQWQLTLDRPVSKAEFVTGDNETVPLDISPDGRVVTMRRIATESRAYNFSWVEREHGFSFTSPRYYVQVSPDQRPNVELTTPRADLYAIIGRKVDLAFRGRDDYGFGESAISYRVNKTAEVKVPFPVPSVHDGSEQRVDWDYRTALPDLAVGDSVSFAVELADRYPGPNGPHWVRSDARRITFLSQEQYLEQIAKQKQRLLSQLQNIYREERAVHDLVRRLDPLAETFVQSCQLEAVRQDLLRDRLTSLSKEMSALIDDLAANSIKDEKITSVLGRLAKAIQNISDDQVGAAAVDLRSLASASGKASAANAADPAPAVEKVDSAARELGLLVLELSYKDACDVIARELHATAQTQASLRLRTLIPTTAQSDSVEAVAKAQEQLAQWLTRLLAAAPREQESTAADALMAFNLSRLAKNLLATGAETKMAKSVALIRNGGAPEAAMLQAEVIQSLLGAEFRLRYGSEYESLTKAHEVLIAQAEAHKSLRGQIALLSADEFKSQQASLTRSQAALRRELQMLLLPAIPARRSRMLDTEPPAPPAINSLLIEADGVMSKAIAHISSADRSAAASDQQRAEKALIALAEVVQNRIELMTQVERMEGLVDFYGTGVIKLAQLRERQLSLLEKTSDAAASHAEIGYLADLQQKLLADLDSFRTEVVEKTADTGSGNVTESPLKICIDKIIRSASASEAALRGKQPAAPLQKATIDSMKEAESLLTDEGTRAAALAKVIGDADVAKLPSEYVGEIESEQRDLIAATKKAQPADYQTLVMPQKNLVHAVNAVLSALDVLAHKVESGSGMLFAKTDMDSAATALESKDINEATDAQSAVADSVHDLRGKLDAATPQYQYVLEITEFFHDTLPELASLRAAQGQLRMKVYQSSDDAAIRQLAGEQSALASRAKAVGQLLLKAAGQERYLNASKSMAEAAERLKAGNKPAALTLIQSSEEILAADTADLLKLMKLLAVVLSPQDKMSDQLKLLLDVLPMAASQKNLSVQIQMSATEQIPALAVKLQEIEKQCDVFVAASQSHPKLVEAKQQLSAASSKMNEASRAEAVVSQQKATDAIRHFVIEYVTNYVLLPGPPIASDAPATPDVVTEQDVSIFMPGAVSGKAPKTGKMEWEVLGRRERAALNENFARELPLEYRAILKDYYERLTR